MQSAEAEAEAVAEGVRSGRGRSQLICDSAAAVVNITSWAFKLPTTIAPKLDGPR